MYTTIDPVLLDLTDVPSELLFALSAKADYNMTYEAGGESDYPHWADDVIRKYKDKGGMK